MLEVARFLGGLSATLLAASIVVWVKLSRGPLLQPIDRRAEWNADQTELASKLLVWAAGLSTAAAVLAVAAWIVR